MLQFAWLELEIEHKDQMKQSKKEFNLYSKVKKLNDKSFPATGDDNHSGNWTCLNFVNHAVLLGSFQFVAQRSHKTSFGVVDLTSGSRNSGEVGEVQVEQWKLERKVVFFYR